MNSLQISRKKSILLLLSYFIGYNFIFPLLSLVIALYNGFDEMVIYFIFDLIYLAFIYYCTKEIINDGFKRFKDDLWHNLLELFGQTLLLLCVNVCCSLVIYLIFKIESSQNQIMVDQMLTSFFWYTAFSSIIFAPIVEETIFRLAIFRTFIKNHFWLPALVSSIAFGGIHVFSSLILGNYRDLVNIITYSLMGLVICRYYYRKDNFASAILLHMMNNLIGVLLFLV